MPQLLIVAGAIAASLFAYNRGYLTPAAACLAALFGSIIALASNVALAGAIAVCFFITGTLSRRHDRLSKHMPGVKERSRARRNARQLLANGLLLLVLALLYSCYPKMAMTISAAILGCTAAVAGDTWASDVGALSGLQHWLLRSAAPVAAGTPGAVTVLGLALTALSGLLAALVFLLISNFWPAATNIPPWPLRQALLLCAVASIAGVIGAGADSLLAGYRRDNRNIWLLHKLDKNSINLLNSVAGAVSATLLWLLIGQ